MLASAFNETALSRMIHSYCASTSSVTVTSPLTARGHSLSTTGVHRPCTNQDGDRGSVRVRVGPLCQTRGQRLPNTTESIQPGDQVRGGRGRTDAGAPSAVQPWDLSTELIRWSRRLRPGGRSFRAGVCFCCVITRSLRKMRNIAVRTITGITDWTGFNLLCLFTFAISNENDEYWHLLKVNLIRFMSYLYAIMYPSVAYLTYVEKNSRLCSTTKWQNSSRRQLFIYIYFFLHVCSLLFAIGWCISIRVALTPTLIICIVSKSGGVIFLP